jgi:ABC-type transport system involved in multi-copper enzyme maturation permease subunit
MRAEWIKLSSLRSMRITLAVSFVLMAGVGAISAAVTAANWGSTGLAQRATLDPATTVLSGYQFAQLAVGILGVLAISNEYSSGMIRATLTAVPTRLPVLWAKAAVFSAVTFVTMTVSALIGFWAGGDILAGKHLDLSLADPAMLRAVLGAGLYLAVIGLIGVALGALLRSTAGAIASLVGILMLLPLLGSLLGSGFKDHIAPYLPNNAGSAIMTTRAAADTLSPWAGFAVMCLWGAIALAAAAYTLIRRDA